MKTVLFIVLVLSLSFIGCGGSPKPAPRAVSGTPTTDPNMPAPDSPFPDRAYRAQLSLVDPLITLKPGQKETIKVRVKNVSDMTWLVYGTQGLKYRVAVGNSWLDAGGKLITSADGRIGLPGNLGPGKEVEVHLVITAPEKQGDYFLKLDMVQELVTWFEDKGSEVLKEKVKVQ